MMLMLGMWVAGASGGGVRDTVEAVHSNQDQIMLALIALVSMSIAALVFIIRNGRMAQGAGEDAATAAKQATAANAAVNNVGPGAHKLYDLVERIDRKSGHTAIKVTELSADVKVIKEDVTDLKKDQDQFDAHGWETLPADISDAVGLTTTIRDLQNNHRSVNDKLDILISELREHVVWEMGVKHDHDHGNAG
jgi:hypothetical protein